MKDYSGEMYTHTACSKRHYTPHLMCDIIFIIPPHECGEELDKGPRAACQVWPHEGSAVVENLSVWLNIQEHD